MTVQNGPFSPRDFTFLNCGARRSVEVFSQCTLRLSLQGLSVLDAPRARYGFSCPKGYELSDRNHHCWRPNASVAKRSAKGSHLS